MTKTDALKSLSDDELLCQLVDMLAQSRRSESLLVAHIAEVDLRRLYAREASPSMFQYCVDVLHLSKSEAYHRIGAARASREHPVLLTMLEDGRLHLSGISVLAPHLTDANCHDLVTRATHKTKFAIKELVVAIAPKPDAPSVIRKLPVRKAKPVSPAANETRPAPPPATSPKPPVIEPLAPARYRIQFTASAELRDKIERLTALMPGKDLASIIDAAVTERLERLEAKRFGKTNRPRKNLEDADTSPGVRGISAPVRRFVWERDGGQCTFTTPDGRRCPARKELEYHHDDPYGLGGDRSATSIRLMCTQHNAYMADRDYGKEKMDEYRRSADRVGEPLPVFELRLDGVDRAAQSAYSFFDLVLGDEAERQTQIVGAAPVGEK